MRKIHIGQQQRMLCVHCSLFEEVVHSCLWSAEPEVTYRKRKGKLLGRQSHPHCPPLENSPEVQKPPEASRGTHLGFPKQFSEGLCTCPQILSNSRSLIP